MERSLGLGSLPRGSGAARLRPRWAADSVFAWMLASRLTVASMPRSSETDRKVLVLGHDTRSFLSVIRSLGRAGIEVHVAWFEQGAPALRSRYVAKAHEIPAYRPGAPEWKDALAALMRREGFDLVIPCDDQRGLPIAAHRAELEHWGRVWSPSPEALEVLGDKLKTSALARSLGVPVPREAIVTDRRHLTALRDDFGPPLMLKPASSYTLANIDARRAVRRADTWEAAGVLLDAMLVDGPVALQEFCPGVGVGVELLLSEGAPLLTFQHVRLHEPLHGGGSSYRRGVQLSAELLEAALKLLAALRYTGVAMVEFKRAPESGRWVLMEVNARFWGSLPLALASGADFPLALFQLLVEGKTEFADDHRVGLCARNLRADARWHLANLRADRSDPTLNTRPWPDVALETCASLFAGRERIDTFTRDDPAPGFAEARQIVREVAGRARLLASPPRTPIGRRRRRRQQAAARTELQRAGRVLFVCKGNIGRSPFAEAIARRLLGDGRECSSAGFLQPGRPSPADAVAAAASWDVDLTRHRSTVVTAELVRDSDAIFVFDERNYSRMVALFPQARDRLHLLGALDTGGSLFVPDPWGRGPDAYAATYRRIAEALTAAISR
jgi:protein-tyrosine-phosphatase/predicted ATP-grasp superfamily ATP-dependent carboligase